MLKSLKKWWPFKPKKPSMRPLHLLLDERAFDVLDRLQEVSGARDTAEVIKVAITLYDFARTSHAEGYIVGAMKEGCLIRRVILPFETHGE